MATGGHTRDSSLPQDSASPEAANSAVRLSVVRDILLLLTVGLSSYFHFTFRRGYSVEDAYISFRYADNLAHGLGFVFNPGERVLGTSTPLWTLLLAGLGALDLDIPSTGAFLYVAGNGLVALLGACLLRRYGHPNLAVVYALIVLFGAGGIFSFYGMETTIYVALLLATVLCATAEKPVATGFFLGLSFLTRYDGFLLGAALVGILWLRDRKVPWRMCGTAVSTAMPWLLFSLFYFGSIFPNTLSAKSGVVPIAQYMVESAVRLGEGFFLPIIDFRRQSSTPLAISLLALTAPVFFRALHVVRRELTLLVLLVFPCSFGSGIPRLDRPWVIAGI